MFLKKEYRLVTCRLFVVRHSTQRGKCKKTVKVINGIAHGKIVEFGDEPGEVDKIPVKEGIICHVRLL